MYNVTVKSPQSYKIFFEYLQLSTFLCTFAPHFCGVSPLWVIKIGKNEVG